MVLLFLNLYKLLRNQTMQRRTDLRLLIEFEIIIQKKKSAQNFFLESFSHLALILRELREICLCLKFSICINVFYYLWKTLWKDYPNFSSFPVCLKNKNVMELSTLCQILWWGWGLIKANSIPRLMIMCFPDADIVQHKRNFSH